jgi:hypothetical protein
MSNINWDVTVRFDPNDLQASSSGLAQHGIKVPSYGNYGGPNYSAGVEGGTTPEPGSPGYIANPPKDPLDQLFYAHDLTYQHVKDGLVPPQNIPEVISTADVTLVEGLAALTNLEPEAFLYDAFATLAIAAKVLTTDTEVDPTDRLTVIGAAAAAIQNFEKGLADTSGAEARSLNGAFHVFEAHHLAQQLVQAMASFGSPNAMESSNIPSPHVSETSQQSLLTISQHA